MVNNRFKRTSTYDSTWINENKMGPNPLWLLEDLVKDMKLEKGMRVLDMGCGKGITSIFLAKEFGVQVFASDLWINPSENFQRMKDAKVDHLVYPIKAEAHALPFAEDFFDAIISIDAYHYFGTDDLYFPWHFQKLVKKNGQIGIVIPGVTKEVHNETDLSKDLKEVWDLDFYSFHTASWWRNHWQKSNTANIELAENIQDSHTLWYESNADRDILEQDKDKLLTFVKMIARRK